jgi:hypothetical protein
MVEGDTMLTILQRHWGIHIMVEALKSAHLTTKERLSASSRRIWVSIKFPLKTAVPTFKGNVPRRDGGKAPEGQQFPVKIPGDHPLGPTIFAWSWTNREQETFMNCAVVNITQQTVDDLLQPTRMIGATRFVKKCRLANSSNSSSSSSSTYAQPATPAAGYRTKKPPADSYNPKTSPIDSYSLKTSPVDSYKPKKSLATAYTAKKSPASSYNWKKMPFFSWFAPKRSSQQKHTWFRRDVPEPASSVQYPQRPEMFFANMDNGCYSPKTHWELQYPNPGPEDDVVLGDCMYPLDLPCGACGKPIDPEKCPVKVPDGDRAAD